jgi:membrane-bound metal-dependent hydrolase YbcI (DUF457 family)
MLDWKLHFIFGLFLLVAMLTVFNLTNFGISLENIIIVSFILLFASLFPDVDMRRSKIRDLVSFIIATVVSVCYLVFYTQTWYYAPVYFLLIYFIFRYLPSKHRGVTHTFKFSLFFSMIIALICYLTLDNVISTIILYFSASFLGYSLHLILDKV